MSLGSWGGLIDVSGDGYEGGFDSGHLLRERLTRGLASLPIALWRLLLDT